MGRTAYRKNIFYKNLFAYNILEKYVNYLLIIENKRKGRIWDTRVRIREKGTEVRILNSLTAKTIA